MTTWADLEAEAQADIDAGRTVTFASREEAWRWLREEEDVD